MKRLLFLLSALLCALSAAAQTPEEILSRMEQELQTRQKEGVYMVVDARIPIVGTISTKTWMRDQKSRTEAKMMGVQMITWMADSTVWSYNTKKNEVEIETHHVTEKSDSDADISLFSGILEGYDVSLQKETPDEWHLRCLRRKTPDEDKDSPKTMTLIVSKADFRPVSLSFKTAGISASMHSITFGVPLSKVTFNSADYPDAKIIDKRTTD